MLEGEGEGDKYKRCINVIMIVTTHMLMFMFMPKLMLALIFNHLRLNKCSILV